MIVGAIALRRANLDWLRALRSKSACLLVIQEPEDQKHRQCADFYFESSRELGFGRARRISMLLSSQLDANCVVADGDGEYAPESVMGLAELLSKSDADVLIPQRSDRVGFVRQGGRALDRMRFEKFEALCALDYLGKPWLPPEIDLQPGMFAFRSRVVQKILPEDDGWLADWEIAVRAISSVKCEFPSVSIAPRPETPSTYTWEGQVMKLSSMQRFVGFPLSEALARHEGSVGQPERDVLRTLVRAIEGQR